MRLPHPLLLLLGGVAIAAALTWVLPAGEFDRREDSVTGRNVVVAGTYHAVDRAPVGPFAAVVAVPRGVIEGADVIALILFVGGAWVVVDRIGTLARLVASMVAVFHHRGLVAIPIIATCFAVMGALENMQEEIIPLVPVLLVLGRGLRVDAVTVVAISAGAAMIGSAFGPTNPFQAGIAMKLAELPPMAGVGLRLATFAAALALWVAWTWRYAARTRVAEPATPAAATGAAAPDVIDATATAKDWAILALVLAPMGAYVYGALALGWGFNELSAGFFIAGMAAGVIGGLGLEGTTKAYLEGMQTLLPAAVLVGVARSISLVLADGHVIDTMLNALAMPLTTAPASAAALLMVPFHALVHIVVPSVSGQAVLTMPLLVPLSDLIGLSRQATVFAYQTGAGLTELLTPTNGSLMAILLAADVPFQRWIRFAVGGVLLTAIVGIIAILVVS